MGKTNGMSEKCQTRKSPLIRSLRRRGPHCRCRIQPQCPGGLQVDCQFGRGRKLERQFGRIGAPHLPLPSVDKSASLWEGTPGGTAEITRSNEHYRGRNFPIPFAGTRCVSGQHWQQTTLEPAWARRAEGDGVKFCPRAGCGKSACPVRAGDDPKLKIGDDRDGIRDAEDRNRRCWRYALGYPLLSLL